ncbi:Phosphatidylserine/phosphatidylglycerophosphate/cardiolipin synthase [Halogranum gelatinilyticum]|uniref:Phosphatidylserine/phosphatidylglycerophosphate/cardiolipin synthase n=1 Tax=Halogranum gelatinilyticum TaxID=660521 RepID=A0A1G9R736_9EURY|nr:phospholipase D-like domain-containing protein [Halogranum gelatinilyticum]SDM19048.1 Phosphatidylserine/phosphatidylglycerophosphate/cardiolipin synthase [Halogranum gelatinilyticum]
MRLHTAACLVVLCLASLACVAPVGTAASSDALHADPVVDYAASNISVSDDRTADGSRITGFLANPVADGDRGEYVSIMVARGGNWTLSDGEATVSLPTNTTGHVVVTATPDALANDTVDAAGTTVSAPSSFALANGGEELTLRRNGTVVDRASYETAPEGEDWRWNRTPRWRPVGLEPRTVVATGSATAEAFVLPDSPDVALDTLRAADDRILLAGYTFASPRVADALVAAAERGVRVRVLVDDAPVGGTTTRQARALDRLTRAGVPVSVLGGEYARYDYHHPKYAVVDGRALVLTENWKPSGVGGRSSRGWGVRVDSQATAVELAEVFRTDADGRDATTWSDYRRGRSFTQTNASDASYPTEFDPATVDADGVRLVTAPGNAESATVGLVDNATERVWVVQPTVGSRSHPFLRAAMRAAERDVEVRILLAGTWYVEEDNRRLADWLNAWADEGDHPLEARLVTPDGRFEKIHAKGMVVDDAAVVGSVNWNNNSVRENREVAVVLDGTEPASYYGDVFAADWRASAGDGGGVGDQGSLTGDDAVPLGLVAAAVLSVVFVAVVAKRKLEFEREP